MDKALKDKRTESNNPMLKQQVLDRFGHRCANCGAEDGLEIHHIVPLLLGGTNNITNLVPLCFACHKSAHSGRHISKYLKEDKGVRGGRKRLVEQEVFDEAFDKYISGQIGKLKLCLLVGKKNSNIGPGKWASYQEAMKKRGIVKIKNAIAVLATLSELNEGAYVGYVEYEDGHVEEIFYHDTGENDVDYKTRQVC